VGEEIISSSDPVRKSTKYLQEPFRERADRVPRKREEENKGWERSSKLELGGEQRHGRKRSKGIKNAGKITHEYLHGAFVTKKIVARGREKERLSLLRLAKRQNSLQRNTCRKKKETKENKTCVGEGEALKTPEYTKGPGNVCGGGHRGGESH